MSSTHTPTHRCPAYHQKQKYQRNMSHPNCKSQVRLQLTLPPPGRVRPLAARRSKWDHQKHQFGKVRPPPQQSRSPFLTDGKGLQWRSGRRHAQSQGNGLPRESRNGDAPLLLGNPTKNMCRAVPVSNTH
ncbi:hypothetical protein TcCL_Unassigned00749 [Trypanosoma cruzi]|nr:hypothetical protein TcCL_Unassigned00749 [Trypanosoma cruzi]